jgi:hypothetical protein
MSTLRESRRPAGQLKEKILEMVSTRSGKREALGIGKEKGALLDMALARVVGSMSKLIATSVIMAYINGGKMKIVTAGDHQFGRSRVELPFPDTCRVCGLTGIGSKTGHGTGDGPRPRAAA